MRIDVRNLQKRYRSHGRETVALGGVSLSVADGEFVAICGESGSGKTTLLNLLCGMDRPDSGEVLLDGRDITRLSSDETAALRRREIGVIYQFYNLIPELNIRDNITLPTELDGREADGAALQEILAAVGLAGREQDFPSALSGGQQQRAAIARALYGGPRLILADEPTGNLDEKNAEEILSLLCRLNRERKVTLVAVTHSQAVAARADRRIIMENGQAVCDEKN